MAALHRQVEKHESGAELDINPVYFREKSCDIPRHRLPEHGVLARTAMQVVRDELILDGNARLNLATFVTTWMEPEAAELRAECSSKNMIDKDEYPQTAELERRCVSILGSLWNAPHGKAIGCSTTGSSEACMLGGMALLWRWRARRKAAGTLARPGAQVAAQYYNFLRLGYSGYKNVQQTCQDIARYLSGEIAKLGHFELLSDGSDLLFLDDLGLHLRMLEHNRQTQPPPEIQAKRHSFAH